MERQIEITEDILMSRFKSFFNNRNDNIIDTNKDVETFVEIMRHVWKNIFDFQLEELDEKMFVRMTIISEHLPTDCQFIKLVFTIYDSDEISDNSKWYLKFYYRTDTEPVCKKVLLQDFILGKIENHLNEMVLREFFAASLYAYGEYLIVCDLKNQINVMKNQLNLNKILINKLKPKNQYNSDKYNSNKYNSTRYNSTNYNSNKYNSEQYNSNKYKSEQYNSNKYNSDKYNSTDSTSPKYNSNLSNSTNSISDKYNSSNSISPKYNSKVSNSTQYRKNTYSTPKI